MIFKQYYLACLSHASYLVGDESSGRCVIVDPQRDISQYLSDANDHNLVIERVIETHFHADFLSGHLELAKATGALISYGDKALESANYPIDALAHMQEIDLGNVRLEIRHTPGHTPESISIIVYEGKNDTGPYCVLTGDTIFIGDVGRPDLLASAGISAIELAALLYKSTRELLALPDETLVYPAHGAGSACGKSLSSETYSTMGEQRRTNYALADMSVDEFIKVVTEGQSPSPLYFSHAAAANKANREVLDETNGPKTLTFDQVLAQQRRGAIVLDTREANAFAQGHIKGSYNVGLAGRYAEYTGDVVVADQKIVLVCDPNTQDEAKIRLARIGFDNVLGALEDPIGEFLRCPNWIVQSSRVSAHELWTIMSTEELQIVDVRGPGEFQEGHIEGAINIPLPQILDRLSTLNPTKPTVVNCAGGYRSMIASSVMSAAGFGDVSDLIGGYGAYAELIS